jgi:hypothetical protein
MYFIDFVPGAKDYCLLIDCATSQSKRLEKTKDNIRSLYTLKDLYCFDLYKVRDFFGPSFPLMNDIQLLYGLQQRKVDTIDELFDNNKTKQYLDLKTRILSHIKSYKTCKIKTDMFSLDRLLSEKLFSDFCNERTSLIVDLLNRREINKECLDYYNTEEVIDSILTVLSTSGTVLYGKENHELRYTIFGSKNSRLTLRNKDFNLYNLPKEKRSLIGIEDDYVFAQFDYKSFQPRIALSLFGPQTIKDKMKDTEDIYSLFEGDRETIKLELISWMYSERTNQKFDTVLSEIKEHRRAIYSQVQERKMILNPFGRPLFFTNESENVVFQNLISSIESDFILRILNKVYIEIMHCNSSVFAPFYDCIIFKINKNEETKISLIKNLMEHYLYGQFQTSFPVSVKIGKNLSDLNEFNHDIFVETFSTKTT